MEFFAVLPIRKYTEKRIDIKDADSVNAGFIKRSYRSLLEKFLNYLPVSFLETRNIIGEEKDKYIEITEQSFKSNLLKLKWDVFITENNHKMSFLLEDKTKISTNPRLFYQKNEKGYFFKKDILDRTCRIYLDDRNITCAEIKVVKLVPASLKIIIHTEDLTPVELLGIYYILNLVY